MSATPICEFMKGSVGKTVRLERGGPDRLEGKLLAVMNDALVIRTNKEGIVYVNAQHVKTLSEPVMPEVQVDPDTTSDADEGITAEPQAVLVEAESFNGVLEKLQQNMVRVNHGGPNALQGILMNVTPDMITILYDMKDYVHYPLYHVRSITWVYQTAEEQGRKKSDQKSDQKSGDMHRASNNGK